MFPRHPKYTNSDVDHITCHCNDVITYMIKMKYFVFVFPTPISSLPHVKCRQLDSFLGKRMGKEGFLKLNEKGAEINKEF